MHDKTILVTGSGSFAQAFAKYVLANYQPRKLVLYSRDEWLQHQAQLTLPDPRQKLRFLIGDVRDKERLWRAMNGVDYVVHSAALKRIDTIEYNPLEAVKTNVGGTSNVIEMCDKRSVEKAVLLSTDKAVEPINLYGATKAVAEKLWIDANYLSPIFNVCRYGNVMGSRGSVLPLWRTILSEHAKNNKGNPVGVSLPITHLDMTRFWTPMSDAIKLVVEALEGPPGEIYIPLSKGFKLTDLAHALYQRAKLDEIGMRPGEKMHECLINKYEALRTVRYQTHLLLTPERRYQEIDQPKPSLTEPLMSNDRENMLSQTEIRELLK